jgi:hypothetical protein
MQRACFCFLWASALIAQDGQQGSRPGWPCVPGRAADPSYLDISESSGGQLFLFQKGEIEHAHIVMGAGFTHPATVLRAVGHLSGTRDFEFPVDSTIESLLVMASLQCRNSILVSRPNGAEMTVANSAQNVDLQAGRILRVDSPEPGKWKVRLTGTGLFVLSVAAKTPINLTEVKFSSDDQRLEQPRLRSRQNMEANLAGKASHVKLQISTASGEPLAGMEATEAGSEHVYRATLTPAEERFRISISATDASGWPVLRTFPNLFRAVQAK